jgi:hypothetical protein
MNAVESIQDQGAFRRSGAVGSRRTNRSERTSNSNNSSLRKKLEQVSFENAEENPDIYFDKGKRKAYFRHVIDNYFAAGSHRSIQYPLEIDSSFSLGPPLLLRDSASSESPKRRKVENINFSRLKLKSRVSMMDFNSLSDVNSLPIIEEGLKGHRRPASEHKISSFISADRDMDESLFFENNKSQLENSNLSDSVDPSDSYKYITIRRGGKRFGKSRVFNSNDNQQLLRELAAKRLGLDLLWKEPTSPSSLEYPVFKSLRELCYSMVEDKNGDKPVQLIYPTPYYYSLFAN